MEVMVPVRFSDSHSVTLVGEGKAGGDHGHVDDAPVSGQYLEDPC